MSLLNLMKYENNKTRGENGEIGYKSTLHDLLDYFSRVGNMRYDSQLNIEHLFNKAYSQDNELAMRALFYTRDIKQGLGEKRVSEILFKNLIKTNENLFIAIVPLIPVYGSFNDLRKLAGDKNVKGKSLEAILSEMKKYLELDWENLQKGESISLAAKWMPTVGNKSEKHKIALKRFLQYAQMSEKEYRKSISALRKELNLVETLLTEGKTSEINYSHVPSQAFKKYTKAFFRNDENRFKEFLEAANKGEVKVNAGTIQAQQLVVPYIKSICNYWGDTRLTLDKAIEAQWKNLPKLNSKIKALPMVDVSGSMSGTPMEVAISLGLYLAENNDGTFKDHILSFTDEPHLIHVPAKQSLMTRITSLFKEGVGYSTDLEKAFNLVLDTAVKLNLPQNELPEMIIVFTDGQMNSMCRDLKVNGNNASFFNKMKKRFEDKGYVMPHLVWWNIAKNSDNVLPVVKDDENTSLISGYSQTLFKYIFELDIENIASFTPENLMLNVLKSERYDEVGEKIKQVIK